MGAIEPTAEMKAWASELSRAVVNSSEERAILDRCGGHIEALPGRRWLCVPGQVRTEIKHWG